MKQLSAKAILVSGASTLVVLGGGAGLSSVVLTPQSTAAVARTAALLAPSAAPANPVTAYVADYGPGTVTQIATAPNTAGTPIPVGSTPYAIAINQAPAHIKLSPVTGPPTSTVKVSGSGFAANETVDVYF